jgi:hypothetical protein
MQATNENTQPSSHTHYTLLMREENAKVCVYVEPANVLLYEAESMEEAFSRMDREAYKEAGRIARQHAAH